MRLFGKIDNSINRYDRAFFGFLTPFDLQIAQIVAGPYFIDEGGIYAPFAQASEFFAIAPEASIYIAAASGQSVNLTEAEVVSPNGTGQAV